MPSILFVCTANRFRSPLSESFFRTEINNMKLDGWQTSSAGTWTIPGSPVIDSAVTVAESFGLDVSSHRSQLITKDLINYHDLILVMESGHKEALCAEYPLSKNRIFLLSEAVGIQHYDIPDPVGGNGSTSEIGAELYTLISEGIDRIIELALKMEKERNHN